MEQNAAAPEPEAPRRPRGLSFVPAFTGFAAMFSAHVAESFLRSYREALSPASDLNGAWLHAVMRAAQEHRRIVVAREVAALILAVLLFIASARVFLRVPSAGWLWRQALAAQVLLAGATVWTERALAPARRRAFFDAVRAAGRAVEPLSGTRSLDETLRALLGLSAVLPMIWATVVLAVLVYATRPRVRAFTG